MDIRSKFEKRLKEERRTKRWFVDTYCKGSGYSRVNLQLLGYNKIKPDVKEAIEKFLKDSE